MDTITVLMLCLVWFLLGIVFGITYKQSKCLTNRCNITQNTDDSNFPAGCCDCKEYIVGSGMGCGPYGTPHCRRYGKKINRK